MSVGLVQHTTVTLCPLSPDVSTRYEHHQTTLVSSGIPLPTFLMQPEYVLQRGVVYNSIRDWRKKVVQNHINTEMFTVSVMFPLLCPASAHTNWVFDYTSKTADSIHTIPSQYRLVICKLKVCSILRAKYLLLCNFQLTFSLILQ
jgi:hypothetical protein